MSAQDKPVKKEYKNPGDFFWDTYLEASKDEDEARPKNWEGSTNGILTFTGLFAATVAAFIVESYTLLSPDSSDRTNVLLEQLFVAMANTSSNIPVVVPPPASFSPSTSAVAVNAFWFSSLLVALICALLATLVQEWSRNYTQDINRRTVLHESLRERAYNHIYIHMGVDRYGMDQFVSWVVALVHLSVFLFACGLLIFLFPISYVAAGISASVLGAFLVIYCAASAIPLFDKSCPYRTPISYMMAFVYWIGPQAWNIIASLYFMRTMDKYDYRSLVTRQYPDDSETFLTDPRFQSAWERTYPQMNDDNKAMFFGSLPSLIEVYAYKERLALLSRMCADKYLMRSLYSVLKWAYINELIKPSSLSIEPEIFRLVALLSDRMFAPEVEHYNGDLKTGDLTNPWLLHIIGYVSDIAKADGPSQLRARLTLAQVRVSILEHCRDVSKQSMPTLDEEKVSDFFREASGFGFRPGNYHPSAILLLLTTGSYDAGYVVWKPTGESTLVPLHNDTCCRNSNAFTLKGRAHVAACNALTAMAHVLESSDVQKSNLEFEALYPFYRFLLDWDDVILMPENDMQKMPSSDFVHILRLAGLDEWLEPGSTFDTPPRDGSNHKFLTESPGWWCVDILKRLARNVNFSAYQASALAAPQTLPLLSGTNDTHQSDMNGASASAASANSPIPQRDLFSTYTQDVDTILSSTSTSAQTAASAIAAAPDERKTVARTSMAHYEDISAPSRSASTGHGGEHSESAQPPGTPVLTSVVVE